MQLRSKKKVLQYRSLGLFRFTIIQSYQFRDPFPSQVVLLLLRNNSFVCRLVDCKRRKVGVKDEKVFDEHQMGRKFHISTGPQ